MDETQATPNLELEAEIEAARTATGFKGLNNFYFIFPGGYRYEDLQEDPEFGNTINQTPDENGNLLYQGKSLREFTGYVNEVSAAI